MSRVRRILTADEMFCLEGWLATGDSSTAYRLSHNSQSGDPLNIQKMASRWLNRPECKQYVETRRRANYQATKEEHPDITANRARADAVLELNRLISSTNDVKVKAGLLLKLADLNRWKQAELTEEEQRIHFYLPLTYDRCRLYFARILAEEFGWTQEQEQRAVKVLEELPQPPDLPTE